MYSNLIVFMFFCEVLWPKSLRTARKYEIETFAYRTFQDGRTSVRV
jgi:hypothetical protein